MGWSGFPVAGGAVLQEARAQAVQIFEALTERSLAAGLGEPAPLPAEDLQAIPWGLWQSTIVSLAATRFLDTTLRTAGETLVGGIPTLGANYCFTSSTLFTEALGAAGFTRKRYWSRKDEGVGFGQPDPPDGVFGLNEGADIENDFAGPLVYRESGAWVEAAGGRGHPDVDETVGLAVPGDIIGPWLWNELKACISLLTHTIKFTPFGNAPQSDFVTRGFRSFIGSGTSDTLANAIAEAKINTSENYSATSSSSRWFTEAEYNQYEYSQRRYSAYFRVEQQEEVVQQLPTDEIPVVMYFYKILAEPYNSNFSLTVFDPTVGGFPADTPRSSGTAYVQFFLVGSVAGEGVSELSLGPIGSIDAPADSMWGHAGLGFGGTISETISGCIMRDVDLRVFEWGFEYD